MVESEWLPPSELLKETPLDILPIILGFALILAAGGFALFYARRRSNFKQCCQGTMARVVDVRKKDSSMDSDWPDYRLTVVYTVGVDEYQGHLSVSYWTMRSHFPHLLEPGARGERSSVPIVVDPDHPKRIAFDSRYVKTSSSEAPRETTTVG